jgi:NADH-quinone oxidoreductase subunit I
MALRKIKPLGFWEKIYIPEILRGLIITFQEMFKPKFTRRYPEEKLKPFPVFRGRPVLAQEENGIERCVACGLCARICPALAISVQAAETENEKERYPLMFEINMLRCVFCGFCEEVCPEEAIIMSQEYELTFSSYNNAIYGKDELLTPIENLRPRIEFLRKMK